MLGELQALGLVVRADALAVHRIGPRADRLPEIIDRIAAAAIRASLPP